MVFVTDVYSNPEMIWSLSLSTVLLKSCSHLSNNAIWIPECVCFCDLLRFFFSLWFLGSVLVMCIRLFVPPYCSLSIRGHFRALGTVSMATVTADKESVLRQGCERTYTLVSCGALLCLLPSISFVKWDAIFVCFLSWAFFPPLVHIIKRIRLLVAIKAYYTTFKDFFY